MRASLLALAVLAVACSGAPQGVEPTTTSTLPPTTTTSAPTTTTAPVVVPELNLGGITTLRVDLADGTPLFFSIVVPGDFDPALEYPVFLAMPPGGQDAGLTHNVTEGWYLSEAVARGWVVVSPAAPRGVRWFEGSERYLAEFLFEVLAWLNPERGRFHVGGVSNGGLSAFRVLGEIPNHVASVTVYPGYALPEDVWALEESPDIPFTMWVGGDDTPWIDPMRVTFFQLEQAGKTVSFEIIPGAPHVIPQLTDGVEIFDALDAARAHRPG